jgi:hypothetical protein
MGLIGGMARTAVVAGTATAVSNRVSRRQAARWEQQGTMPQTAYGAPPPQQYAEPAPPPPPPPAPAADEDDMTEQLAKLANLHNQGILSDAEFAAAKAKVLGI